jgi:3'-5' exoribonuclease
MPRSPIRKLSELRNHQLADFFALLSERAKGATRDGKPYFNCKFRDARRTVACMIWSDSDWFAACEHDWQPGLFFKLRATFEDHRQYGPRIDLHNIRLVNEQDEADGFNRADLLEHSRFDPAAMFAELRELAVALIGDEALRTLVLALLDRHAEALRALPATTRHYYPFPGGWLEHTLSVTKNAHWLATRYREQWPELAPPLNVDLVVAGAILHEIGRVAELQPSANPGEPAEKTTPGQLFGHIALGRDLVREAAREIPSLDPRLAMMLEHLVHAHLALPEWGSPRLPAIPEVLIVHHADDLDAKMEMFARCLRQDASPGPFTERDPILGRPLLKDRQA